MNYPHQHNQRTHLLIPLLAISALAVTVCKGSVVLSDNFDRTGALVGSSPQTGGVWTGSGPTLGGSVYDSSGNGYQAFDTFTSALGVGQVITLSYDTLAPSGGGTFSGWGGTSLYSGGTEEAFTGNSALGAWGTDGNGAFWPNAGTAPQAPNNHQQATTDSTLINHITFTYAYDTGAYSFSTLNQTYSGFALAGVALDNLRIGNGNGGNVAIDNLTVDISPVPEPASMALLGLGALGLVLYRRRQS